MRTRPECFQNHSAIPWAQVGLIPISAFVMAPDQMDERIPAGTDAGWSPCHSGEGTLMSQGPRGGWVRRLFAGLGAVLCMSVIGCNDIDKPKLGANAKQPGPGLPGTARLPGQPGMGGVAGGQPGLGSGMQPIGNAGMPVGRGATTSYPAGANTTFGTNSNNNQFVPAVGPNTNYPPVGAGPVSPAGTGLGAGSSTGPAGGYVPGPNDTPGLAPLPPQPPGSLGGPITPPGTPRY